MLDHWQTEEENNFKEFYLQYFEILLEYTFNKIRSLECAEEIVQDAFLYLYNSKKVINGQPYPYLRGILKHKIVDFYRKNKKVIIVPIDTNYTSRVIIKNDIIENIEERETSIELNNYIQRLPPQCKNVFLMSREENLPNKAIAAKLGISVKAVEAHISRGLKYLKQNLNYRLFWLLIYFLNDFV